MKAGMNMSEVPIRINLRLQWSRTGKWLFSAGGAQTSEGPKERKYPDGSRKCSLNQRFHCANNSHSWPP